MRPRLLLTFPALSPFVEDDISLLSERYDVRTFAFEPPTGRSVAARMRGLVSLAAKQRAWLRSEMPGAEVAVCWFADYHAVLPVQAAQAAGVPVAVILGGFDSNRLPELDYGVYESAWRAPLARYVVRHADLLLPVSASLIESEERFASWPVTRRQGVRAHVPDLQTPHAVVPTGYDPAAWPLGPPERGRTVCTVGYMASDRSLHIKGGDLVIRAARQMPDAAFTIVGVPAEQQGALIKELGIPGNVLLVAPVSRGHLAEIYGTSSVYVQMSRSEGMPNVLCEAMLCGCIPVGSRVSGIPDAIGSVGEIVDMPDVGAITAAIQSAFARAPEGRKAARERIVTQFSRERRRSALYHSLEGLRRP